MDFDLAYADYLTEENISEIQKLEEDTGTRILAYYTPPAPADLNDQQLENIRELEKKLCVRLVAYHAH
ncbi:hypothetical protein D3OALGA1CA_873 [Olavius algarvensis associated proteobacterium Delta 3]|nr:hypothetical protein D3OALGA1CA_873 [Olavius algarvensis associated proteobacterium Delta 3]CAB5143496.1 hypothetical protein D3OALGB2SA_4376 [Olavius algarvensis associated proteobacterium Delta 3]